MNQIMNKQLTEESLEHDHGNLMRQIINKQLPTPLLTGSCIESKRTEIKSYFLNTWQTYESLFSLINNDGAFYSRPETLRHPLIFYFGHTATFFINKLKLGKYIDRGLNAKLEAICAVGVDEMSWDDLNSEHYDWPAVDEVREYREHVSDLICKLIDDMPMSLPITQDSLAWIVLMGIEHERIHLETSSVIMRMLPVSDLTPTAQWQACEHYDDAPDNQLLKVAGKALTLGKTLEANTYGWDNEYGEAKVDVPDFKASEFLVSNQEFLTFVEAGGYQTPRYWTEEGQQWLSYKEATMPRFWLQKNGQYFQRNLLSEMPLPMNWPVEVNYLEAKAFCNFKAEHTGKNIRLPSEPEWYCLRDLIEGDITDWQATPGNTNLAYYASSSPVNEYSHQGFYDIVGNVWQWTESAIDGFNGFKVHPLYDDFSTPTFDGKHNLIKGGSWISTGNETIKHSRYAFRRHFFQHAGFRYVEANVDHIPDVVSNHYEKDEKVCQQLASHYGQPALGIESYPRQIVNAFQQFDKEYNFSKGKLLDIGCSVGLTSFLLAPTFNHVDAIDFTARYIQHGVQLQQGNSVRYQTVDEGELVDYHDISLKQLPDEKVLESANNILFSQGDASNLKTLFSGYDVILAQHIVEQSYAPATALTLLAERVKAKGYLLLLSDYQFNEATVDKKHWLGGLKVNGENVTGFEGVQQHLTQHFVLCEQKELQRVISQSKRNHQVSNVHLTLWRKK